MPPTPPLVVVATLINPLGPVLHTFTLLPSLRLLAPDPGLPPTLTTLLLLLTLLLPQLLLGLSLSQLSTLLLMLLALLLLLLFTEAAAADEAFFGEALRTQLSKLDTKVSSLGMAPIAEPTPPTRTLLLQTVVEGEAALYREAEVICLLIGIAIGAGDTDEDELADVDAVADVVAEREKASIWLSICCCCCCGSRYIRLARGRDTTTRYRVRPARNDSSLTAILRVSSGRSR